MNSRTASPREATHAVEGAAQRSEVARVDDDLYRRVLCCDLAQDLHGAIVGGVVAEDVLALIALQLAVEDLPDCLVAIPDVELFIVTGRDDADCFHVRISEAGQMVIAACRRRRRRICGSIWRCSRSAICRRRPSGRRSTAGTASICAGEPRQPVRGSWSGGRADRRSLASTGYRPCHCARS